jgi:hypothetical protein
VLRIRQMARHNESERMHEIEPPPLPPYEPTAYRRTSKRPWAGVKNRGDNTPRETMSLEIVNADDTGVDRI